MLYKRVLGKILIYEYLIFVICFIALFVFLMRQLHCDCQRLEKTQQDRTQYSQKNIPPSIKYKLSVSSTLCRCDQTDWLHLSLTLGSLRHSCCSGQCGHAASSWVKKSGGGEEVFMIKSIVGWHNNTQLISSLVSGRRRLSQRPWTPIRINLEIPTFDLVHQGNARRTLFKIMQQFYSPTTPVLHPSV